MTALTRNCAEGEYRDDPLHEHCAACGVKLYDGHKKEWNGLCSNCEWRHILWFKKHWADGID